MTKLSKVSIFIRKEFKKLRKSLEATEALNKKLLEENAALKLEIKTFKEIKMEVHPIMSKVKYNPN